VCVNQVEFESEYPREGLGLHLNDCFRPIEGRAAAERSCLVPFQPGSWLSPVPAVVLG